MKPAMTSRRMNNKPEIFAMVPDIIGDMIIIWGNEPLCRKPLSFVLVSQRVPHISHRGDAKAAGAQAKAPKSVTKTCS
jgi:hypothetical protein